MQLNHGWFEVATILIVTGNVFKIVLWLTGLIEVRVSGELKARLVYVLLGLLSALGWLMITGFTLWGREIFQSLLHC